MKKQIRQDVLNFIDKFSDSAISAYSGQSAFFLMLSFFPFMLFFFSLLNLTPLTEADFVKWTQTLVPESFHDIIDGFASDVYASGSGRISITVITAIYLSSKAFISLQRGLDDMYQVRTRKNFIFIRLYSILYSIVFAIILICCGLQNDNMYPGAYPVFLAVIYFPAKSYPKSRISAARGCIFGSDMDNIFGYFFYICR